MFVIQHDNYYIKCFLFSAIQPEQVRVRTGRSTIEGQGWPQNKSEEGTKEGVHFEWTLRACEWLN